MGLKPEFTSGGLKNFSNKKVILRERKRHTARRIASTHCAALSNPDLVGGYPVPGQGGTPSRAGQGVPHPRYRGYPIQTWSGGTPGTPPTGMGYPLQPEMGYPRPGMGYPLPRPRMGCPPIWTWDGVPPYLDLGWGTPLPRPEMGYPPCKCGQTENITSRHPSDAGGKKLPPLGIKLTTLTITGPKVDYFSK